MRKAFSFRFWHEVIQTMIPLTARASFAAKLVLFLIPSVVALVATDKVKLSIFRQDGTKLGDLTSIEIGTIVLISSFFVLFVWAIGATWVRFSSLLISDKVEQDGGTYLLAITNTGFADANVQVQLMEIASAEGSNDIYNVKLPYKLRWSQYPESDVLHYGITRRVVLFAIRAYGKNDSFGTKAALSQLESFSFWEGLS